MGPMGPKKGMKKEAILLQIFDVFDISQIVLFVWGHFWKYKPPGGLPETRPGFLETQITAKSQGLKTVWSISFDD